MRSKGVRVAATSEGNKDIETIINRKNQFSNEIAENKRAFYVDLEMWGILPKSRERWNPDGSWNY